MIRHERARLAEPTETLTVEEVTFWHDWPCPCCGSRFGGGHGGQLRLQVRWSVFRGDTEVASALTREAAEAAARLLNTEKV